MGFGSRRNRCNACGGISSSSSYCTNCGNVFDNNSFSPYEIKRRSRFSTSGEDLDSLFPDEKVVFTCKAQHKLKKAIITQRISSSFIYIILALSSVFAYHAATLLNYAPYAIEALAGLVTVAITYGLTESKRFNGIYVITDKKAAIVYKKKVIKSWNRFDMGHVGYNFRRIYKIPNYSVFFWKKGVNDLHRSSVLSNDTHARTVVRTELRKRKDQVVMFPYLSKEDANVITNNYLTNSTIKPQEATQFSFNK